MRLIKMGVIFGFIFSLCSPAVHAAEPVAMITDVKGSAYLVSQKKGATLSLLTYLPAGEEIVLDAGAQVVVTYFAESAEFAFKGPGRVAIQEKAAKALKGAVAEVRHLDKEKAGSANKFARSGKLAFATVEMRSLAIKPTLLSPVNTKISATTPQFKWKSLNEADNYHVSVEDEAGQVIVQADVNANVWQTPADIALKPGVTYRWSVVETLKSGEKLTSKGSFSIADPETVARVFSKQPAAKATFSDRVTFAIYLESEGFREDAKAIWRELAALRPDDISLKLRAR